MYVIGIYTLAFLVVKGWIGTYEETSAEKEEYVGKTIVINGDTLVVTNYSVWNDTYQLSNGSSVAPSLVENQQ